MRGLAEMQRAMQEAAGSAGVDHETRADLDAAPVAITVENRPLSLVPCALEARLVQISGACDLGFVNQSLIEVRAIPVRIGDRVMGTGGDEQLPVVIVAVGKLTPRLMKEKREAAFEAAPDTGTKLLPWPPLAERAKLRQVVTYRQLLEQKICQRGR